MFNYQKFYDQYSTADRDEKARLLGQLKVTLYFNYGVFFKADVDMASDFLCEFFPQLEEIIERYKPEKASFFNFFRLVIRQRFFRFQRTVKKETHLKKILEIENHQMEYGRYDIAVKDYMLGESDIDYNGENIEKVNEVLKRSYFRSRQNGRQDKAIEKLLLCRAAHQLGDEKVVKLCDFWKLDKNEILRYVSAVNKKNGTKFQRNKEFEARVGSLYYKMKLKEFELECLRDETDNENYRLVLEKYNRNKKSWHANTKHLHAYSTVPSYSNICSTLRLSPIFVARKLQRFSQSYREVFENDESALKSKTSFKKTQAPRMGACDA